MSTETAWWREVLEAPTNSQTTWETNNGVLHLTPQTPFEEMYLRTRDLENRVYSDEVVRQLPKWKGGGAQEKEWAVRRQSTDRFIACLQQKKAGKILDLGCGNGWFSSKMVSETPHQIFAMDVNAAELEQGARVFDHPNLQFCYGDIFEAKLKNESFDLIVMNACIQYFSELVPLFQKLLELLKEGGEMHILDSPFYKGDGVEAAKQRSESYYTELGVPEMAANYFHHDAAVLEAFNAKYLYQPGGVGAKFSKLLGKSSSPFPWVRIAK